MLPSLTRFVADRLPCEAQDSVQHVKGAAQCEQTNFQDLSSANRVGFKNIQNRRTDPCQGGYCISLIV